MVIFREGQNQFNAEHLSGCFDCQEVHQTYNSVTPPKGAVKGLPKRSSDLCKPSNNVESVQSNLNENISITMPQIQFANKIKKRYFQYVMRKCKEFLAISVLCRKV